MRFVVGEHVAVGLDERRTATAVLAGGRDAIPVAAVLVDPLDGKPAPWVGLERRIKMEAFDVDRGWMASARASTRAVRACRPWLAPSHHHRTGRVPLLLSH